MKTEKIIGVGVISTILLGLYVDYQRKKDNITIFSLNKNSKYNAITIPPFGIFIKKERRNNENLLNHEIVHWEQFKKLGMIKFYSNYIKQFTKFGYDNMPMEIEARYNESPYCKTNYTEYVRKGFAKTICDENFRK